MFSSQAQLANETSRQPRLKRFLALFSDRLIDFSLCSAERHDKQRVADKIYHIGQ